MALPSIFDSATHEGVLERLNKLTPETQAKWGKMDVAQMLAHLNVGYDLTYGKAEAKYNGFTKLLFKIIGLKGIVTGEKPYKKNGRTAPVFMIADLRVFEDEKQRLMDNIQLTYDKGTGFFEGKESPSFGKMTVQEWSNQFYKHMDHHFQQFGV